MSFFNVLSIFQSLQGKNIDGSEFNAIGDFLSSAKWDVPACQEYKNDLVQPDFLQPVQGVPKAATGSLIPSAPKPDPESPATEDQWKKVAKMVA